jgi:hypothetical protein
VFLFLFFGGEWSVDSRLMGRLFAKERRNMGSILNTTTQSCGVSDQEMNNDCTQALMKKALPDEE